MKPSALSAMREGAQDYLVKGKFNTDMLARAIRYGIERHRLRMKLEDSERFFRTLIQENADGLVLVIYETKEVIYVNPAAESLLESSADQLLGKSLDFPLFVNQATVFRLNRKNDTSPTFVELRSVKTTLQGHNVCLVSMRDITGSMRRN